MAEVDTSSYPRPGKPVSPLETLSGVAGLQTQLNQNRLFKQEYNSKLGLSQIYKEAIDPATGQIDPTQMNRLLADPQASSNVTMGLPQAIQNSQEAQQRNIGIDTSRLENARAHLKALTGYLAPLAAGNPTPNDIASTLAHANASGIASPDEIAKVWASIPRDQKGEIDQSQIKSWVQQNLMRVMSAQEQLNMTNPAPTAVDSGNQINLMRLPQMGEPSMAGVVQKGLPPTTQVIGPDKRPHFVGSGGGVTGGAGELGPQAGFAPGEAEAAGVDATASANQGVQLQQESDQVPAQKALLGNLEGALDKFEPGPGQGWKNEAKKLANLNNPFGPLFDVSKIASQEEFNKQAIQLAQAQFKTLGGTGTDAKLDSTMHTSPNDALSKMGNKGIIAMLKGNADAIATKNRAWQDYKQANGPQSYGQFSTDFNKSYDPRVFQSQYLTVDDRKKMIGGMSKSEQKSFLNSYRTAITNGWVKFPGAQ